MRRWREKFDTVVAAGPAGTGATPSTHSQEERFQRAYLLQQVKDAAGGRLTKGKANRFPRAVARELDLTATNAKALASCSFWAVPAICRKFLSGQRLERDVPGSRVSKSILHDRDDELKACRKLQMARRLARLWASFDGTRLP